MRRRVVKKTMLACALLLPATGEPGKQMARAQSTKPPQQPLYLPDPTPRQRDLSLDYPESPKDPAPSVAKQQQDAAVRRQNRAQMLADVNAMIVLADMLREHAAHADVQPTPPLDRMAIQKIEQLAKDFRARALLQ